VNTSSTRTCAIPGCRRDYFADGYCGPHYKRKWRHGDPLAGGVYHGESVAERVRRLCEVEPSGCWRWLRGLDGMGYGTLVVKRQTIRAHRASYEAFVGPIPDGLDLDHLCRNKACVNPAHLEPVTHSENLRRHYATVTSCPQGHVYDEANTYRDTSGKRRCRVCLRDRQRLRRANAGRRAPSGR
jgi:hypothetical protein